MSYVQTGNSVCGDPPDNSLSARDENFIERVLEERLYDEFDDGADDALQVARDYVEDNPGEIVRLLIALDQGKESATDSLLTLIRGWRADSVDLRKYSLHAEELRAQIEREEL